MSTSVLALDSGLALRSEAIGPLASGAGETAVEIVDTAPIGGLQIGVFAMCALVTALDGFNTQAIAFVAPVISKAWSLPPFTFGLIFSATLLGSVIGTTVFGSLADRVGRRGLTIAMTAWFGLFGGLAAFTTGPNELLLCRFIGGIGLGGVIPNTLALASEFAPRRLRSTIVTATLWGFPAGAILGGFVSGPIIAGYGWQGVFLIGGFAPLAIVPLLFRFLPESLDFLALRPDRHHEARRIVARIAPGRPVALGAKTPASDGSSPRGGVAALFAPQLAVTTMLLSTAMFLSLLLSFLLVNWVPMILSQGGMKISNAILGTVALNAGGIAGSFVISRTIDRNRHGLLILAGGYAASGLVLALIGYLSAASPASALGALVVCGAFLIGSQMSMTAFSAQQFPVTLRGTGVGMVQGVGRFGSLFGPLAGGALLGAGLSPGALFATCLVPAMLAATALLTLAASRRRTRMEAAA